MTWNFAHIKDYLIDLLFPLHCVSCQKFGEIVCSDCLSRVIIKTQFVCPFCGHFSFQGACCFECQKKFSLDGAWSALDYKNKIVRDMIYSLKFHGVKNLSDILSKFIIKFLEYHKLERSFDVMYPVPLHRRRFYERGFNQAQLLAMSVSQYLRVPLELEALERKRATRAQSKLDLEKRVQNVKDAFVVSDAQKISWKNILLVDDVLTTGHTLDECAKVLKKSGANKVWALVVAGG